VLHISYLSPCNDLNALYTNYHVNLFPSYIEYSVFGIFKLFFKAHEALYIDMASIYPNFHKKQRSEIHHESPRKMLAFLIAFSPNIWLSEKMMTFSTIWSCCMLIPCFEFFEEKKRKHFCCLFRHFLFFPETS